MLELLVNEHNQTGENPLWDERRHLLFWCDIPQGQIWSFDPKTGSHRLVKTLGRECGAFALREDGQILLLFVASAALLNPDSGAVSPLDAAFISDSERYNDCIADPTGRVFAGTVDWKKQTRGGLFLLGLDGKTEEICRGTACSNGLGFTPDLRKLYWADSTAKTVFLWDYDAQSGALTNKTAWLETPELTPDGMTVDSAGDVWVAYFDGPFVRHYGPDAVLKAQIEVPAKHVTSCIFGGAEMDELYITTGGGKSGDDSSSGALFRLKTKARGQERFRARVGM